MSDDYLWDERFFDMVELGRLGPVESLESLSGSPARRGGYETSLIEQGETAWRTRFCDLSCAQVSTLIEQKMGLAWLGRPALEFASRYPLGMIQYYPGEIGVSCLRAAAELAAVAQPEFGLWMAGDFSWIEQAYGWDPAFLSEVRETLARAREVLRRQ